MIKKELTEGALVNLISDIVEETLEIRVAEALEAKKAEWLADEKKKWISESTIMVNKMLFEKINHLQKRVQLLTSK